MRDTFSIRCLLSAVAVVAAFTTVSPASAQTPRVFSPSTSRATHRAAVRPTRSRNVRVAPDVLRRGELVALDLFDDVRVAARRTKLFSPRPNSIVWTGTLAAPDTGHVVLSVVNGALSGTVFAFGRTFEILPWADGTSEVREIDPAAFPSDDPALDAVSLASPAPAVTEAADTVSQIDVMVVWTPGARNAVNGTVAGIQSLVDTAVANANTAYTNSGVPAQLRLVYSGEVNYTEATADISGDLTKLARNGDGVLDAVHSLRTQYGADVVTLLGNGYTGACGVGYLMDTVSTSFSVLAFNVVDQACAAGNLSYAHEVGHNEGLQHDPASAGSTPAYPYAFGYQDPSGAFRTVMSYGGAPRVAYFSSPTAFYNGLPAGVANSQDNARALAGTAPTVAAFKSVSTAPPACSYSVSPTSLSFASSGGTARVSVTAPIGCSWSAQSGLSWVALGTATGSGSASVTVTVPSYTGTTARTGAVTVAGVSVGVTQQKSSRRRK